MLINATQWTEFQIVDTIWNFQTTYIDSEVTESQSFKYRVKAVWNDLSSAYSNEVTITPNFPTPAPPSSFSANVNDYESIELFWTDTNHIAVHFDLQRSNNDTSNYSILTPFWNRDTSFIDESIPSSTLLFYKIRVTFGNNSSNFINLKIFSPQFLPIIAPSNLIGMINDSGKVDLTWVDNSNNEKEFIIIRGKSQIQYSFIGQVERSVTTFIDSLPKLYGPNSELWYGVRARNPHSLTSTIWFYLEITDVQDHFISETSYALSNNYPNPFNPSTKISYQIPALSFVNLKVYNILGKEVTTLVNEEKPAGNYELEFRTDDLHLSSGIYFYRLQSGDFVETKKMILLR